MLEYDEFVRHVISATRMKATEPVNPYADLYDNLGLDLMGVARLMRACERLVGIPVRPESKPMLYCLADAFAYYKELYAAASGTGG